MKKSEKPYLVLLPFLSSPCKSSCFAPLPTLDVALEELIAEEIRLRVLFDGYECEIIGSTRPKAFFHFGRYPFSSRSKAF
jgi:hypothetical protein